MLQASRFVRRVASGAIGRLLAKLVERALSQRAERKYNAKATATATTRGHVAETELGTQNPKPPHLRYGRPQHSGLRYFTDRCG
jgi:hypothetical protein